MASAKFPGAIWDGTSATRSQALDHEPVAEIYREPSGSDWNQAVAEIIAVEKALQTTTAIAGAGNAAALATTATSGFTFLPQVAGIPTGVPANVPTGYKAACYDSVNKKIAVYDGGWIFTPALV